MNYVELSNFDYHYLNIGLSGLLELNDKLLFGGTVAIPLGVVPLNFGAGVSYFFSPRYGLGLSSFGYQHIQEDFVQYHRDREPDLFAYTALDYRYISVYNTGVALGLEVRYTNQRVLLHLKVHSGVRFVEPMEFTVNQKRKNSNYIRVIDYTWGRNPNFYLLPAIDLNIHLIRFSNAMIGFRFRSSCELSDRSINYTMDLYEWTESEHLRYFIKSPTHPYLKVDYDLGLSVKW